MNMARSDDDKGASKPTRDLYVVRSPSKKFKRLERSTKEVPWYENQKYCPRTILIRKNIRENNQKRLNKQTIGRYNNISSQDVGARKKKGISPGKRRRSNEMASNSRPVIRIKTKEPRIDGVLRSDTSTSQESLGVDRVEPLQIKKFGRRISGESLEPVKEQNMIECDQKKLEIEHRSKTEQPKADQKEAFERNINIENAEENGFDRTSKNKTKNEELPIAAVGKVTNLVRIKKNNSATSESKNQGSDAKSNSIDIVDDINLRSISCSPKPNQHDEIKSFTRVVVSSSNFTDTSVVNSESESKDTEFMNQEATEQNPSNDLKSTLQESKAVQINAGSSERKEIEVRDDTMDEFSVTKITAETKKHREHTSLQKQISSDELQLRNGNLILDLDHALLHIVKKERFPPRAGDISEETTEVCDKYKLALRCGTKLLVKSARALGLNIHIVTQNLLGKEIIAALEKKDKKVWYGLPVHVVKSRAVRSKSLRAVIPGAKYLPMDLVRKCTVILDDQVKSWVKEDESCVLRVRQYDLFRSIKSKEKLVQEKNYLLGMLLRVQEFFSLRMKEERNSFYQVSKWDQSPSQ
mmetsp:Transcript_175/g.284  ORF Transcript_175/g.284 Transcript_175/m.284 type:complete len:582 (+) Transcript_175:12-1757(+)